MPKQYIVREATENGTHNVTKPTDQVTAASVASTLDGKVWIVEINICSYPGCTSKTPYDFCRRHQHESARE